MFEQKYITTLKQFLGDFEMVATPDRVQVYDGVDIHSWQKRITTLF